MLKGFSFSLMLYVFRYISEYRTLVFILKIESTMKYFIHSALYISYAKFPATFSIADIKFWPDLNSI